MRRAPARTPLRMLACGGMAALALSARAAEWAIDPSVSLRAEYNDNIQLTTAPHPTVWGAMLSPDVKFIGATETLSVTGGLNLSFNRYVDQTDLDSNNYALTLRSIYRASERDQLRLNIDSTRDPTVVSELAETGVVLAYRQRTLLNVTPSWSRSLTESTSLVASYGYTAVDYADSASTGLTNYRDQYASVALQSNITERHFATLAAYYDLYKTDPATYKTQTWGVRAGYVYAFSETIKANLYAGVRETRSTLTSQTLVCDGVIILGGCLGTITTLTSTASDNTTGWTLDAYIEKRTETDLFSAQLSRQIYPSGNAQLVQTDRFALTWSKQWTQTLNASITAAVYQTQDVGTLNANDDSRYLRIEPRLSWRLDDRWTLDAGYRYARQKYDNSSAAAAANVAYASIRYVWPRIGISR